MNPDPFFDTNNQPSLWRQTVNEHRDIQSQSVREVLGFEVKPLKEHYGQYLQPLFDTAFYKPNLRGRFPDTIGIEKQFSPEDFDIRYKEASKLTHYKLEEKDSAGIFAYLNNCFFQVLNLSESKHNSTFYAFNWVFDRSGEMTSVVPKPITVGMMDQYLISYSITIPDGSKQIKKADGSTEIVWKTKDMGIGKWWRSCRERRCVSTITFLPSLPPGFIKVTEVQSHVHLYNLWSGYPYYYWAREPFGPPSKFLPEHHIEVGYVVEGRSRESIQAQKEDDLLFCAAIDNHLTHIMCGGNEEYAEYFRTWLATVYQRPELSTGVAIIFRGDQGAGKTSFEQFIASLFGQTGVFLAEGKDLTHKHGGHIVANKVLVAADELLIDTKEAAICLKNLITGEFVREERKGIDIIQRHNFVNLFGSTNSRNPLVVDKGNNRRYGIFDSSDCRIDDLSYFNLWYSLIAFPRAKIAYSRYLSLYPLNKVQLRQVPLTAVMHHLVTGTFDNVDNWWFSVINRKFHVPRNSQSKCDEAMKDWVVSPVDLISLYDMFAGESLQNKKLLYTKWLTRFQDLLPLTNNLAVCDKEINMPRYRDCVEFLEKRFPIAFKEIKKAQTQPKRRRLDANNNNNNVITNYFN